jgi:two-component system CheB/CheR fusion protein
VTGLSREQLIGTDFSNYFTEPGKALDGYQQVFAEGYVTDYPLTIRHRDGRLTDVLYNANVYTDSGGNVLGVFAAARDITERRKTEADLARHREHLEELVKERTAQLETANARLSEANRRKDEFLAMLGHELRNPLAAVAGAVRVMGTQDLADPVLEKARAVAERQSAHMARMLDDLLDVSRITEGKVKLKQEQVALADVIDSSVETARPLIEAAGHRLYLSLTGEPLRVLGDPVRLAQVIGNLLNNAAKYTPAGGEIHLTLERRSSQAAILVRDNGFGIAPELLPHIFDLFVQGERGPDRSQGGLGIGLTMARHLVEMHGGRIEATSAGASRGSEFTITLPLAHGLSAVAEEDREVQPLPPSPRRRILVVDDNPDGAEMLALLLENEGHEVRAAHNGAAALDLAASYRPDMVLLDIGMPGMDGYEVARRLKQEPTLSRTMLIALTGYGQEEDVQKSRNAGFDYHLVKPLDLEALRRLLRQGEAP